jgi:CHAT domain
MKILYLGTRGEGETPLSIEREVNMFTRMFADTLVEFRALPWVHAESLVEVLSKQQFDVLHITAHGEGESLQVLNEKGTTVMMSAEHIAAFVPPAHKLRLVYLNACDSEPLARQLVKQVPFAIGSTLPLANDQAIHGALSFYWRVLLGGTIQEAFEAARGMIGLLSGKRAEVALHEQQLKKASQIRLLPKPRILAAINGGMSKAEQRFFEVTFGADGVPAETSQIVFFTDDENVIDAGQDEPITAELCAVARGRASREGALWCDALESWDISGDFPLFAIGVTSRGTNWTASSSLCEALEAWHGREKRDKKQLNSVLNALRRWGQPGPSKPAQSIKRAKRQ